MDSPVYTMGIDVGSNFIKLVLMDYSLQSNFAGKTN